MGQRPWGKSSLVLFVNILLLKNIINIKVFYFYQIMEICPQLKKSIVSCKGVVQLLGLVQGFPGSVRLRLRLRSLFYSPKVRFFLKKLYKISPVTVGTQKIFVGKNVEQRFWRKNPYYKTCVPQVKTWVTKERVRDQCEIFILRW